MTRTFVAAGEPAADVVEMHRLCLEALENVTAAAAPGRGRAGPLRHRVRRVRGGRPPDAAQQGRRRGRSTRASTTRSATGWASRSTSTRRSAAPAPSRSFPGDVIAVEPGTYRQGYGGARRGPPAHHAGRLRGPDLLPLRPDALSAAPPRPPLRRPPAATPGTARAPIPARARGAGTSGRRPARSRRSAGSSAAGARPDTTRCAAR